MRILKSRWTIGVIVCLLLVGGYFYISHGKGSAYQLIPVTKGSITQTVAVSGNTTPLQSVSLAFQNAGTIASVNYSLGQKVSAGTIIAQLDTTGLSAAVQEAQANVAVEEADLASLQAGTTASQLAVDENAVTQAQASVWDAIQSAYVTANDAVHNRADQLFTNPNTTSAEINFVLPDFTLATDLNAERSALNPVFTTFAASAAEASQASGDPSPVASSTQAALGQIGSFLNNLLLALQETPPSTTMTAAMLSSDETSINTGLANVSSALSSLTTDETALVNATGALSIAQAGPTPQAIAAQQAQVQVAEAGVASAKANLQNAELVAPISGTLTQQDAKVGQQATPGAALVSIIGNGGFEVDAGVSDTDVGEVAVGDPVTMTLDAFPNQTFTGSVFYVAPAETEEAGVVSYLVKISIANPIPQLKSGLTANVNIQTATHADALILPEYAILENNNGTFVETLQGKTTTTTPVTLGIEDTSGNVEVLSGVTAGEEVVNIGLKAQ